jgi:hypothetical protein
VLTVLGDLGLTAEVDAIRRGSEFMFRQQREDGMGSCRGEMGKGCLQATLDARLGVEVSNDGCSRMNRWLR